MKTPTQHPTIPPLVNGDKLTGDEFHRRYNAMPNLKKAELIEGIVYIGGAVGFCSDSQPHGSIIGWLGTYAAINPKLALGVEPTVRLDLDNQPQPDAVLLVTPEAGGQARLSDDDYIEEATELIVEIAASSVAIEYDLRKLRNEYT